MSPEPPSGRAELDQPVVAEGSAVPPDASAERPLRRFHAMPAETGRLFPHYRADEALASSDFLVGRLLEDGDGADLRWLFRQRSKDAVRGWLRARAGRQLSTRSRAFWALISDQEPSPSPSLLEELWLL